MTNNSDAMTAFTRKQAISVSFPPDWELLREQAGTVVSL